MRKYWLIPQRGECKIHICILLIVKCSNRKIRHWNVLSLKLTLHILVPFSTVARRKGLHRQEASHLLSDNLLSPLLHLCRICIRSGYVWASELRTRLFIFEVASFFAVLVLKIIPNCRVSAKVLRRSLDFWQELCSRTFIDSHLSDGRWILWLQRHSQTDVSFTANNYTPRSFGMEGVVKKKKARVYLNRFFTWHVLSPAPRRFI